MKVEFINPFVSAAQDVFGTMLNCRLVRGPLALKRGSAPEYEVSGIIGLTGKAQGMVVVSLGRELAMNATAILTGHRPLEINAEVVDAVGELANMIAGAAKSRLAEYQMSISLPSVICGRNHAIAFPSQIKPLVIPFSSDLGDICLDVGLISAPVEANELQPV